MHICNRDSSMGVLSLFLSLVFRAFNVLAPLSGQALDTGKEAITSAKYAILG